MIQFASASVRLGVIARTTPNHPLRLAALFAASAAFFAIVGGAAGAVAWVVEDVRASHRGPLIVVPSQAELDLPPGVIALQRAADAGEFKQLAGFKPFIPGQLPEHTKDDVSLSVALPDDNGVRAGRVGFSSDEVAAPGGITGPTVVLWETAGEPDAAADGDFEQIAGAKGRVLVATIGCGGLTLKMELYFHPEPAPGEPHVTPYIAGTAAAFLDGVREQCR